MSLLPTDTSPQRHSIARPSDSYKMAANLGGGVQPRQYASDSSKNTFIDPSLQSEPYRSDGTQAAPSYSTSAQPTSQPYYQYPGPGQQAVATTSNVSSAQQSPAYLDQTGPDQQSPADNAAQDDAKRQRACEACRGLKVRCDQDPLRPDIPCKRCAKAGRACVITQPNRKRQKKADSRVAELEKKLDALTAALEHRHGGGSTFATPATFDSHSSLHHTPAEHRHSSVDDIYDHSATKRRRLDEHVPQAVDTLEELQPNDEAQETQTSFYDMSIEELKARINALVPFHQGAEFFKRYTEQMTPYMPMVVFPPGTDAKQVFDTKPILYLAIITAASGNLTSRETPVKLQQESMGAIADCVVKNGAKSLELIQAMLIMACWYKPPERAEQTNFYQIIHMAAVMALDIGLGRRSYRKIRTPFSKPEIAFSTRMSYQNTDSLDARRAWLGCYYLCATSSMVLRRPNLVRWTEYMKECIEVLETSPNAFPGDKLLCQHIKIQHICEDIGLQFLMDDSTAQVSINDPKVTYALATLESQLRKWKQQVPEEAKCASLTFFEHVTSLYLHEIALHFNHNIEDFRLPFTEESLKSIDNSSDALTQNQIAAIEACLKAAHGILDTMINFTSDELLSLPLLLFFVRCIYALVILLKMHGAINTPNSELGKLMQNADLKIGFYLDAMINNFLKVVSLPSAKPEKALRILQLLREWYQKQNGAKQQADAEGTVKSDEHGQKYEQTPLHMLSQVATGRQDNSQHRDDHADWTFSTPSVFMKSGTDYPDRKYYQTQQSTSDSTGVNSTAYNSNMLGMMDMNSSGWGWGSGFEQAMDMTLGSMGELQGEGLDNWFLGENAAPFAFNDSIGGATGQL